MRRSCIPVAADPHGAGALGYTEPDPRDDLSGLDVARKPVILAREAGRDPSLDDVAVESLVPANLRDVPREVFLARIADMDAPMAGARAGGGALRYLVHLNAAGCGRVGLVPPPPGHASLHGRLTDNLIELRTARYADNPPGGAGLGRRAPRHRRGCSRRHPRNRAVTGARL